MSATRNEMGGERSPSDLQHTLHEAGPHVPVFTGDRRKELDELLTRYPTKMAALLPALWIVQEERGWVSSDAMVEGHLLSDVIAINASIDIVMGEIDR